MPVIKILPHASLCPEGKEFVVETGTVLCRAMLDHSIAIELSCACTTCHVIVREGFSSLEGSEEKEDDMLDKAWGLSAFSRLSCQMVVANADLTIEIPKYTVNHAREENH
jgi:ferredoxin, 2Fe-2S